MYGDHEKHPIFCDSQPEGGTVDLRCLASGATNNGYRANDEWCSWRLDLDTLGV